MSGVVYCRLFAKDYKCQIAVIFLIYMEREPFKHDRHPLLADAFNGGYKSVEYDNKGVA